MTGKGWYAVKQINQPTIKWYFLKINMEILKNRFFKIFKSENKLTFVYSILFHLFIFAKIK